MSEFMISNYGQERGVNATEKELEVFSVIVDVLNQAGHDASILELTRKASGYVTAVIRSERYGPLDICRFKFTDKASWIVVPCCGTKKIYITDPEDVRQYAEELSTQFLWEKQNL